MVYYSAWDVDCHEYWFSGRNSNSAKQCKDVVFACMENPGPFEIHAHNKQLDNDLDITDPCGLVVYEAI